MRRKMEYIPYRNRYCEIVELEGHFDWFDYRNDEEELPKVGAFCKTCAKETAKPIYPIYMNGKPAYALQCKKCGGEYSMYKHMFIARYVGYDTRNGGHVNPTHGLISHVAAMDRKARDYHNSIPQRVEDHMCETFGYTHEEYRAMKKEWEKDSQKITKELKMKEQSFSHVSVMSRFRKNLIIAKNSLQKAYSSMLKM